MNILLLRDTKGENDPYHLALSALGNVESIPVLSINVVDFGNCPELLQDTSTFDSIIFTSANATKAMKAYFDSGLLKNLGEWRKKQCYVVGKGTEKCAKDLGFDCLGSTCGNSKDLAEFIIKEKGGISCRPLLFPCGQMKKETLPDLLKEAGLKLECVTVYETTEHANILKSIERHKSNKEGPTVVVFFSPSGVRFSLPKFKQVYGDKFDTLHFCAIGHTTADELRKEGHPPKCTAESPSAEGLLHSLQPYISSIT